MNFNDNDEFKHNDEFYLLRKDLKLVKLPQAFYLSGLFSTLMTL